MDDEAVAAAFLDAEKTAQELAAGHREKAISTLADVCENNTASDAARVSASVKLLEIADGKPGKAPDPSTINDGVVNVTIKKFFRKPPPDQAVESIEVGDEISDEDLDKRSERLAAGPAAEIEHPARLAPE